MHARPLVGSVKRLVYNNNATRACLVERTESRANANPGLQRSRCYLCRFTQAWNISRVCRFAAPSSSQRNVLSAPRKFKQTSSSFLSCWLAAPVFRLRDCATVPNFRHRQNFSACRLRLHHPALNPFTG